MADRGAGGSRRFRSFAEFYPFYLGEHRDPTCVRLHVLGTGLALATLGLVLLTGAWAWIWLPVVLGYGFAWAGHAFFERNRPATFSYPLYSLMGDFRLFMDVVTGRRRI